MPTYEKYWLDVWSKMRIFESDPIKGRKKIFVTFPYPYMNGPLHVGHCFSSSRVDIYARFKRMQGYNVLFPWAWHWTGQTIVGMSYLLKKGDERLKRALVEIDGVPEKELQNFTNPEYLASYYTKVSRQVVKDTGFSIDWRREFTTVDPAYKKFVEWQYLRLRERGYVIKGTHPVVWCSHDQSPTGDHDRLEGVGISPEEFYLVKFKFEDSYLVAGTLRPETIYGATNIWINAEAEYCMAEIKGEKWIVSASTVLRLTEQKVDAKVIKSFRGSDIIGKRVTAPITGASLPILPANFVDPELATGIVYSVPAHAPYDYVALVDIQSGRLSVSEEIRQIAKDLKPISIIDLKGYSEFPALDFVKKLSITDSMDQKLEQATAEVYKEEYHNGVMKPNTGELSGLKVKDAKQKVIEMLDKSNALSKMLELPQRVVCRCGTRCYVKILENQWFLNYSNQKWKEMAKECISQAKVFPPESREWYFAVIDWLKDWPCARKTGMGTKLPWDKDWIVETLSDSTIYMCFYIISKYVNLEKVKPEQLSPEVFDYIFLGKGDISRLARKVKIDKKILKDMREEFLYWYPVDLRNSAKELIPNHLTFFAFHHVALFDREFWPKSFSVNGMIKLEGKQMSKSHGIFVTWKEALEKYGADALRATLAIAADGMDDADWRSKNAEEMKKRIDSLIPFIQRVLSEAVEREVEEIDRWLFSTLSNKIEIITNSLEEMKIRKAISTALLEIWNDIRWYIRRAKNPRIQTMKQVFHTWAKLLSPFTPFIAEEMNKLLGGKGLVCISSWPSYEEFPRDEKAELSELLINNVLEDARNVMKVIGKRKRLNIYTTSDEVYDCFKEIVNAKDENDKVRIAKEFSGLGISIEKLIKIKHEVGEETLKKLLSLSDFDEFAILNSASEFLSKELGVEVRVIKSGGENIYDPMGKSKNALPLKPAFFFE